VIVGAVPNGGATGPAPSVASGADSPNVERSLPRRGRGRRRRVILAVAIAAALVVAIVLAVTILRPPAAPSSAVAFSTARAAGASVVNEIANQTWTLLTAAGVDQRSSATVSVSQIANSSAKNCTPHPVPGYPSPQEIEIPSFGGAFSSGLSPLWVLLYSNGSIEEYLLVAVENGEAAPLSLLEGTNCTANLGGLEPLSPAIVDSPVAAAQAWSAGGSSWGTPALTLIAVGGGTFDGFPVGLVWLADFAPCGILSMGGPVSGTSFVVYMDGTSGSVSFTVSLATTCVS